MFGGDCAVGIEEINSWLGVKTKSVFFLVCLSTAGMRSI